MEKVLNLHLQMKLESGDLLGSVFIWLEIK
jgi:hypothetical protein